MHSARLPESAATPDECWAARVRRKMGLASEEPIESLEEPKRTWARYMLTAVERGEGVVAALAAHGWRPGLRFMDAGCAYGGYLVAAARAGAGEVVGIDVDPEYLALAQGLLGAHGVTGRLELGGVEDRALRDRLTASGGFDVVTFTDVVEHVADPALALQSLSGYLVPGGHAYITAPNFRHPGCVRADPHFKIPGITLLPPVQAKALAYAIHPWLPRYSVGEYHTLAWYRRELSALGMDVWLLNPPPGDLSTLAASLRAEATAITEIVASANAVAPAALREACGRAVLAWSAALQRELSVGRVDPDALDEYAVATWELLAVRR